MFCTLFVAILKPRTRLNLNRQEELTSIAFVTCLSSICSNLSRTLQGPSACLAGFLLSLAVLLSKPANGLSSCRRSLGLFVDLSLRRLNNGLTDEGEEAPSLTGLAGKEVRHKLCELKLLVPCTFATAASCLNARVALDKRRH